MEEAETHGKLVVMSAMEDVKIGDDVLIRGTVIQVIQGVGALVRLMSKTDQYDAWICVDDVAQVVLITAPDEPVDDTWLIGDVYTHSGDSSVFHRDDAEGHCDPDRRYDRHWWDFSSSAWIDWPTAVKRGANPTRRLIEAVGQTVVQ